jgi:2-oxoglutarate dehydrogenase E1 component
LCDDTKSEPGAVATGSKKNSGSDRIAIIRLEQFYPFPVTAVKEVIAKYPNAKDLVWCQEEPKNMGAWTFIEGHFEDLIPGGDRLRYVGRAESPSPATGNYAVHTKEQEKLVSAALTID